MLNERDVNNLPDKEFKALVIKMLIGGRVKMAVWEDAALSSPHN